MTMEHAETIVRRYKNGQKWRHEYEKNTLTVMRQEYKRRSATIQAIAAGHAPEDEDPEFVAEVQRRHQMALEAEVKWRKDSIAALKREYRMSTDTLMKMVEQDQDIMSITKRFLTGAPLCRK